MLFLMANKARNAMNDITIEELTSRIQLLHNRVIEIKGSSVFNEENATVYQSQSKRQQNVKVRED